MNLNVLIFPAGTEIGLEIFHALKSAKGIRLFAAGQDSSNHAKFLFQDYYVVPHVADPDCRGQLDLLCRRLAIDYIFPCHDDAIVALSDLPEGFPARAVVPSRQTCLVTRSKRQTYHCLHEFIRVPRLYDAADKNLVYPVLVKPDRGQGSSGVTIVRSAEELPGAMNQVVDPLVCEYLPGKEFTVDCISAHDGNVMYAQARRRDRMRNGISVSSTSVEWSEAMIWAVTIAKHLPMIGAWFFQVKEGVDGELALLEVAPRIAGSMALHRMRGVNFPLLSLLAHDNKPFSVRDNMAPMSLDRALSNRFSHTISFDNVYFDYDDTIIVNGRVNEEAIRFLYQCLDDSIYICLITRYKGDLTEELTKRRIDRLFDHIIHIRDGSPKSGHMTRPNAILIDDSFSERNDAELHGIKAFDPSMLECLINNKLYRTYAGKNQ